MHLVYMLVVGTYHMWVCGIPVYHLYAPCRWYIHHPGYPTGYRTGYQVGYIPRNAYVHICVCMLKLHNTRIIWV